MSAIDKLDESLLALVRFIGSIPDGDIRSELIELGGPISMGAEAVRAELAATTPPKSYDDPAPYEKTLRDEFAMHAAPSILIHNVDARFHANFAEAASLAYELADAMLAAREPPP